MSEPKKKIGLIAKKIIFTDFSITYIVEFDDEKRNKHKNFNTSGIAFSAPDIKEKDLIMNPCYVDFENREVIFVASNVMPHFYKDIIERKIRHLDEYEVELKRIYQVGEIVGYILV